MGLLDLFKSTENKKIKLFETRLDEMETQMRLIRMEWQEAYDKVHHALDRVAKRWNRLQDENNGNLLTAGKQGGQPATVEQLWAIARQKGMLR
jgi:hypothetical protein